MDKCAIHPNDMNIGKGGGDIGKYLFDTRVNASGQCIQLFQ